MGSQKLQSKQCPRSRGEDARGHGAPWEPIYPYEQRLIEGGRVGATAVGVTLNSELLHTIQKIWAKDVLEALGPGIIDPLGPVVAISNGF